MTPIGSFIYRFKTELITDPVGAARSQLEYVARFKNERLHEAEGCLCLTAWAGARAGRPGS